MARYAIIGSREVSEKMYDRLVTMARILVRHGHEVATGGAKGADEAAMVGAASVDVSKLHVYLPWASYNEEMIPAGANTYLYEPDTCPNWAKSVDIYHPNPAELTRGPRALHARNFGILMYPKQVDAVIAVPGSLDPDRWGGTGQGMRIAIGEGVPLFNMRVKEDRLRVKEILEAVKR